MNVLTASQVRDMVTKDPEIKLVMVLGERAFAKAHIPKSLNISNIEIALKRFPKDTKIIVYCSDEACMASYKAYQALTSAGYTNIWRFAGGLMAWEAANYPLASLS